MPPVTIVILNKINTMNSINYFRKGTMLQSVASHVASTASMPLSAWVSTSSPLTHARMPVCFTTSHRTTKDRCNGTGFLILKLASTVDKKGAKSICIKVAKPPVSHFSTLFMKTVYYCLPGPPTNLSKFSGCFV
jgi:hypothetical protein